MATWPTRRAGHQDPSDQGRAVRLAAIRLTLTNSGPYGKRRPPTPMAIEARRGPLSRLEGGTEYGLRPWCAKSPGPIEPQTSRLKIGAGQQGQADSARISHDRRT